MVVLKYSRQLKYDDGSIQKKYYSLENYINSDGLLYKEVSNSYKDESYTKILRTLEATYSDFNKKISLDYESAEKLGNNIDGKTFEEGKKLLGL